MPKVEKAAGREGKIKRWNPGGMGGGTEGKEEKGALSSWCLQNSILYREEGKERATDDQSREERGGRRFNTRAAAAKGGPTLLSRLKRCVCVYSPQQYIRPFAPLFPLPYIHGEVRGDALCQKSLGRASETAGGKERERRQK